MQGRELLMGAAYPRRPAFFSQRVIRLMFKTCAANQIGVHAVGLVVCIASVEDAKRYSGPVTFYNGQLLPLLGITKWETLDRARQRAVEAGWLYYDAPPSGHRAPGVYWTLIPDSVIEIPDGPVDEG